MIGKLGEPEIRELGRAVFAQKNVGGLHVPVDNTSAVSVGKRFAGVPRNVHNFVPRKQMARRSRILNLLLECSAVYVFENQKRLVTIVFERIDGGNIGVIQPRDRVGFLTEALDEIRRGRQMPR
jgi:hypothetical protein